MHETFISEETFSSRRLSSGNAPNLKMDCLHVIFFCLLFLSLDSSDSCFLAFFPLKYPLHSFLAALCCSFPEASVLSHPVLNVCVNF